MTRRSWCARALAVFLAASLGFPALAASDYPNRPIKIYVGFARAARPIS